MIYLNEALGQIQRLISTQDREPFSKTYGCFDRTYWSWKFTDFPGARFQEGVYALAYLFTHPSPSHSFADSLKLLEWAKAGMRYWQSIQYPDGSFDEAYPEEHSLAATAFTAFYAGEAYRLLEPHLEEVERAALKNTLARAGNWLCRNDESHGVLSNHLAAAAAALQTIYRISGSGPYFDRSRYFLERIYKRQSPEGWYEEYEGADPGYQTHATFYLAHIWKDTKDERLFESLKKSLQFLKYCIHPNGTLGGEYGSRNTEFYFPAGFEMLASNLKDARLIRDFMRPSVKDQAAAGLRAVDAYNFCPLLNNYLFAHESALGARGPVPLPNGQCRLPFNEEGEWYFQDAGLLFKSTSDYYAALGLSKGGVLKVYDQKSGRLIASDSGYWAKTGDGKVVSSQSFKRAPHLTRKESELSIKTDFNEVSQKVFHPRLFLLFRLYSVTFGRFRALSCLVKRLLVYFLILRKKAVPLRLTRKVRFERERILISDEVETTGEIKISELRRGAKFSSIHMGSARYFQAEELGPRHEDEENLVKASVSLKSFKLDRTISSPPPSPPSLQVERMKKGKKARAA